MPNRKMNRAILLPCAITAAAVLWATGLLLVRLKPYWVAKYRGEGADLRGAIHSLAPLRGSNLMRADLHASRLGTDLHSVCLLGAPLPHVELGTADLRGADLRWADLRDLVGANLAGSIYTGELRFLRLQIGREEGGQ